MRNSFATGSTFLLALKPELGAFPDLGALPESVVVQLQIYQLFVGLLLFIFLW